MQRIAIIDIGSNSARLVITHIYKNGAYNMVYNQKEALRLSQKIDKNGNLTQQAFTDTIETMKSFAYGTRRAAYADKRKLGLFQPGVFRKARAQKEA